MRDDNDILTPRIVGGAQDWRLPRLSETLNDWERQVDSDDLIRKQGRLIQETLALFGVPADFEGAYKGPSVTQYLIKPGYIERTVRGEAATRQGQSQQDRQSVQRPGAGPGRAERPHRSAHPRHEPTWASKSPTRNPISSASRN